MTELKNEEKDYLREVLNNELDKLLLLKLSNKIKEKSFANKVGCINKVIDHLILSVR